MPRSKANSAPSPTRLSPPTDEEIATLRGLTVAERHVCELSSIFDKLLDVPAAPLGLVDEDQARRIRSAISCLTINCSTLRAHAAGKVDLESTGNRDVRREFVIEKSESRPGGMAIPVLPRPRARTAPRNRVMPCSIYTAAMLTGDSTDSLRRQWDRFLRDMKGDVVAFDFIKKRLHEQPRFERPLTRRRTSKTTGGDQ